MTRFRSSDAYGGDISPLYRRDGTSHAAAISIEDERLTLRERCFNYITTCRSDGATDIEIAEGMGWAENTARPRRYELEKEGRIIDSGMRRKTPSGRNAIVWIVTPVEPKQLELV